MLAQEKRSLRGSEFTRGQDNVINVNEHANNTIVNDLTSVSFKRLPNEYKSGIIC